MWADRRWIRLDKGAETDEHYPKFPFGSFPGFKLGFSETELCSVWELLWVRPTCLLLMLLHVIRSR